MPPALRGTAAAAVFSAGNVANPTTLNPTLPAHQIGDTLLCHTSCRFPNPTVATPAGWTVLYDTGTVSSSHIVLFGRIATSTTMTAPTVVWSGLTTGNSGSPCGAQCAVFSGLIATTTGMVDVAGTDVGGGISATSALAGLDITTSIADDLVLILSNRQDDAGTWTAPTGFTTVGATGTTSGADFAMAWAYNVRATPGLVAVPNWTLTGASSFQSSGVQLALKAQFVVNDSRSGTITASGSGTETYVPPPPASRYDSIIDVDSPVSHWKLGNATIATDRKGVRDLPAVNGPIATSSALVENAGQGANALTDTQTFSTTNSTGFGVPYDTGTFSLEAWVRLSVLPPGDRDAITRSSQVLQFRDDGKALFSFKDGTNTLRSVAAPGAALGAVQHVVVTHDNTDLVLYLNGVERNRVATAGGIQSSPNVPLGIGSNSEGFTLACEMDEIAWYDTALSLSRVATHYNAGIRSAYDQVIDVDLPVSHWKLGDTDMAYDRKGTLNLPAVGGSVPTADSIVANNNDSVSNVFTQMGNKYFGAADATDVGTPYESTSWTWEAWVTLNSLPDISAGGIVFSRVGNLLVQSFPPDGQWTVNFSGTWPTEQVPTVGIPYHLVVKYDAAGTMWFYINGVVKRAASFALRPPQPNTAPNIGTYPPSSSNTGFPGVIDEVAWYDTELSDVRIAAHFAAGSPGDRGSGTITASGSRTESWSISASAAGVVTASGTKVESYVYTDSGSATVTASGVAVESRVYTDAASATGFVSGISIESHTTLTTVARISLSGGLSPATRTDHKLCFRARKTSGSEPVHLWAALYQGSTNRSGDLVSGDLTTSLALYELPIPDASAASISSYSDLELRFWGESPQGSTATVEVSRSWLELPLAGDDVTPPIPTVTVVDVTKISRVVGKDVVNVTFTTDEAFVEYEVRRVSSGSDPQAAGNQVETASVSSRTSHSIAITDDELVAAAAGEGSNTLKIFVKDVVGNWST